MNSDIKATIFFTKFKALFHFRFNFEGCLENLSFSTRKDNMNRKMQIHSSGTSHCIILWWDLILDEEEDIILSMAPKISSQYPDKVVVNTFFCNVSKFSQCFCTKVNKEVHEVA